MVGAVLVVVVELVTHLDPYVALAVVIALLIVFILALTDRQKKSDALKLAMHNADVELEKHKLWMQQTGALTSDSTRSSARLEGIMRVEALLEIDLQKPGMSKAKKAVYEEIVGRIRDLETAASPFPSGMLPFPIREQMEKARKEQEARKASKQKEDQEEAEIKKEEDAIYGEENQSKVQ